MEKRNVDFIDNYKPRNAKIIFKFIQDIADGTFSNKTEWGLQVRNKIEDVKTPRWAQIIAAGPECPESYKKGSYILIEQLMWTEAFKVDDVKYWATSKEKILAISQTEPKGIF